MKKYAAFASLAAAMAVLLSGCVGTEPASTSSFIPALSPLKTQTVLSSDVPYTASPDKADVPSRAPTQPASAGPALLTPSPKAKVALSLDVPYSVDLDKDGKNETVTVKKIPQEGGHDAVRLSVRDSGGNESLVSMSGDFLSAYLFWNASGVPCAIISVDMASADYETTVCRFNGTAPVESCSVSGEVQEIGISGIKLFDPVYVLGTWDAYRTYTLSGNFLLKPSGDGLWHVTGTGNIVTAKKLPVQLYKDGAYKSTELAGGTAMHITATDQKKVVYFKLTDGRKGKLAITRDSYRVMINGVEDIEWFEFLPYAG